MTPDFLVWEGVYERFSDAPVSGPGFSGPIWRERSVQAAREALATVERGEVLDYSLRQRNALLPVVVALLLSRKSRVSVLDFGGGLGTGFMVLAGALGNAAHRVSYCVVEIEGICAEGRALLGRHTNVTFRSDLPRAAEFDLVFSASALQYVEEWRALAGQLAAFGAPYLALGDCFAGRFGTFATLQNYYGSRIAHWFFNRAEFENVLASEGYSVAMRAECDARILGRYGPLPMPNFPPELQLQHSSHFLFERANAAAVPIAMESKPGL